MIAQNQLNPNPNLNNDKNYNNILIGNSKFIDDVWDLSPLIKSKTMVKRSKTIEFSFIVNENVKYVVKQYAYYRLSKVKPQTVVSDINKSIVNFIKFMNEKCIKSFKEVDSSVFEEYIRWLKQDYEFKKKRTSGDSINELSGYHYSKAVEELIKVGQIKDWDVSQDLRFIKMNSSEYWETKKVNAKLSYKPIPEDFFNKILYYAVNKETDILTKAGIIIQSQTGLRISEVLSIKKGCIKANEDGTFYMEVTSSKTEKGEPILHKVYVNELVINAVEEITKATDELRQKSGLQELFICEAHKPKVYIGVYKSSGWNNNKLKKFIKRWDIRDNNGELFFLQSHMFRSTFVRELIKQNVPIAHIMKHFNHVSIEMTDHYLMLKESEVKQIYADMVLRPESKIAGLRATEITEKLRNQFKGKTEQEIDSIVEDLSKTMSFNPLPTGVCLYDFRRGNCVDGDGCFFYNCPNYITESRFYPILKKELDLMEKEMARFKELGRERDWQRQYVKWQYLKPLVDRLEVEMNEQR
ncbi:MAG: site-specific integrase [Methanobacterium paludis]|nr:site-specific integrase [Methanobacterium paludis]